MRNAEIHAQLTAAKTAAENALTIAERDFGKRSPEAAELGELYDRLCVMVVAAKPLTRSECEAEAQRLTRIARQYPIGSAKRVELNAKVNDLWAQATGMPV